MAAGSLAASRAGSSLARLRRWLVVGLAVQGIGMIGSAAAPGLMWAAATFAATFAVTGAGNAFLAGPGVRLFQELVADRLLGRAFGLRDTLGNLAYALAFVSAGVVLAALGVRAVFALGGTALLALALTACLRFRPDRPSEVLPAVAEPA
jgi:MFS family permease